MVYHVVWEIDIDAETPTAAAVEAYQVQRDPGSFRPCFTVKERGKRGAAEIVDLEDFPGELPI